MRSFQHWSHVVTILGQTSLQAGGERAGRRIRATITDIAAIGELPLVRTVSPEFMLDLPVASGNRQTSHMVRAVAASYGEATVSSGNVRLLYDPETELEGKHILLVEDKKAAHIQPLKEVRPTIEKILAAEESKRLEDQWLKKLRDKTFVRTY